MLFAYAPDGTKLQKIEQGGDLSQAVWIDLYRPMPPQIADVEKLGVQIPTLADMEEIEISNRIYRENGVDYYTVVLPGLSETKAPVSGPVCFILQPDRLITVRHHAPRPFETYPLRADKVGPGCGGPRRVFMSLLEEVVGRLADLLEGAGRVLDTVTGKVFHDGASADDRALQNALQEVAHESDLISRVRLSLLTVERALSYFSLTLDGGSDGRALKPVVKGLMRDINALEVHCDFLSSRVAMAIDVTLGMVNLAQNKTIKILSVVSVLFLPPTMIASAYGMNFVDIPELDWSFGYPMALILMMLSAVGTFFLFKWRKWL
ncbi:magnesium transporter CorA family protein [Paracoccus aestuariivivens]|uniref:Magnesium transport protein CorA n=1 Tax=Paracoccus aestuariivivens TaxID=1820333 RepID=A0A6L6J963_9RHOB|nr:magnesium transporter CorA family protein [Paracoccus aestuariivivens]MTH78540.1 magnesium transporter [Paracoccus aestuariivivens]